MSITTCVIGNIDTESAKELTKGHIDDVPRASAEDCADAIIQVWRVQAASTCISLWTLGRGGATARDVLPLGRDLSARVHPLLLPWSVLWCEV